METLASIFGSEPRAKLIRLFAFNPEGVFTIDEIRDRTGLPSVQIIKVADNLAAIGLLGYKAIVRDRSSEGVPKGKRAPRAKAYFLNRKFPHLQPINDLVASAVVEADHRLADRITPVGRVKLIVASGVFARQMDSRIDLLVVGDDIDEPRLARVVKGLEQEIGRELTYSVLATADYEYRQGMQDRLIRDVVDFPHIVLVDKVGFGA